jgi:hypothetical protein
MLMRECFLGSPLIYTESAPLGDLIFLIMFLRVDPWELEDAALYEVFSVSLARFEDVTLFVTDLNFVLSAVPLFWSRYSVRS